MGVALWCGCGGVGRGKEMEGKETKMSSWFSRSKKPPGAGAASGGNEGYNVPDDDSV